MQNAASMVVRPRTTPILSGDRRVALLEENAYQAGLLSGWLAAAGFLCSRYLGGQSLLCALRQESVDLLVMDWHLSGPSASEILKQVRLDLRSAVPVLLVSASESESDIVAALRHGADDYMTQPLHRRELLARLEALGRRRAISQTVQPKLAVQSKLALRPKPIELGALRMDCEKRTASRDRRPIQLTARQFDLAAVFLLNIGRLLSRRELQTAVWGAEQTPTPGTLYGYISSIRARLGLIPANGWHLAPVHRRGYRLLEVATSGRSINRDSWIGRGLELPGSACAEPMVVPHFADIPEQAHPNHRGIGSFTTSAVS